MSDKLAFVFCYVVYIVFLSWLLLQMGVAGVAGLPTPPANDVLGTLWWFITVNFDVPALGILNALINVPLFVAFLWCVVELVRGV